MGPRQRVRQEGVHAFWPALRGGVLSSARASPKARALVDGYNACQPAPVEAARLTVYPRASHNVWTGTYDGSAGYDIYAWLLAHHR